MPMQEAGNFCANLLYVAEPVGPSYASHAALEPMEGPWTPDCAEAKEVVEGDIARQKRYGTKKLHPAATHLALEQLRAIVAREIAGPWDRCGGVCARLADMAGISEVALRTNQDTAPKLVGEKNREWEHVARGRHDAKQIATQLRRPNHLPVARVMEDQRGESMARVGEREEGYPSLKDHEAAEEERKCVRPAAMWKEQILQGGRDYGYRREKGPRCGDEGNKDDRGDEGN